MKMTVTARNMVVSQNVLNRIEKKTSSMSKYLLPDTEMQVKMKKEKNDLRTVEITVPMGNNVFLRAESSAEGNLFMAIDQALAKIERQIHRHKERLGKRIRQEGFKEDSPVYLEEEPAAEKSPKVVRHKTFPVRPMSVEDAMVEMEMLGHSFFAFVNVETERTNILYLRKDGDLGLLEPEA